MLTQMVELLIQQEPTLLAQRTVDTRRYIMDQWDRTHRAPIDENALAVFLYDETHSSLPEEQKIFAREKGAEVRGRYSPIVNGQRMARNVYAKTEAECEKKLAELIREMKAEIAAGKKQAKQKSAAS